MPTAATTRFTLAAAFALLLSAAPALAENKVKVTGATVGFPVSGHDDGVAKFAAWAPVYVSLEMLGEVGEPAQLLIQAPDADEIGTSLAIPINLVGVSTGTKLAAADLGTIGYVRPANAATEVTITVRTAKGSPLSEPFRVRVRPREALQYVVLALGGAPANFALPKPAAGPDPGPLRNGRIDLAHISTVAQLPDQWFGYDAADLVLLNTGAASPEFLKQLFASDDPANAKKRGALFEWVRRGGRLVVSVGANAAIVSQLKHLARLLPYTVKGVAPTRATDAVALYWSVGVGGQNSILSGALGAKGGPPFALANLVPKADVSARVLIPPPGRQAEEPDTVAAQAAFGLGRITVLGFDLDRSPFAEFSQRAEFWDWVLRECGANRASGGGDGKARQAGSLTEEEDEAAVAIRQHNDTFEGVAVVSFGWIALLIVLYILLIGPIEYYFLKRVFGRLELTWITFPIIVLTVSAAAYFSADAVKGRELKVNKVDVVDVDPASDRIYGTTWFTVFSPKIDKYTIGVRQGDEWGDGDGDPEVNSLGAPRGGRPGIVRRKYSIHTDSTRVADGLEGVPIQVWSTKAFAASWSSVAISGRDEWPAVVYSQPRTVLLTNLSHPPGDRTKVIGTFTHRLPVPVLSDCVVFYAGQAYALPGDVIVSGEPVRLVLDQGTIATQWLQTKGQLDPLLNRVQSYAERPGQKPGQKAAASPAFTGALPLWGVLFHEAALKNEEGAIPRNASLRRLDQSWRLTPENRDEIIVVGRVAPQYGPAEEVLTGPNSPSKLWLKGLPGAGERWKIPGTARQETWVRFYLPVR